MTAPLSFNSRIIEALYVEALQLSDEVRQTFASIARPARHEAAADRATDHDDRSRATAFPGMMPGAPHSPFSSAFSSEGLRTTTRMMHAIAWLLNYRAFLNGEMSAFQLHRCGHLPPEKPEPALHETPAPPQQTAALVERTRRFHDRVARLDSEWRRGATPRPDLLERLSSELAAQHAL